MLCLYIKQVGNMVMVYDNNNNFGIGRDRMEATKHYEKHHG